MIMNSTSFNRYIVDGNFTAVKRNEVTACTF